MYVIIAGCGRVGASLVNKLSEVGNDVVVIDRDTANFSRLGSGSNCITIAGMPIDEDVLKEAGIEKADALAAVTTDDNTNVMIAQIAQQLYRVPFVIIQTDDPEKQRALTAMGLKTVCATTLAVDSFFTALENGDGKMRIMIIGGGNVGYYLTKSLSAEKHHIMIVEEDRARCEQVASDLDSRRIEVTCGDGTDLECLREAGIFHTDVLVAVTGHDQNNLVACQLAKEYFGVRQTISRVKNPKNIRAFEKLGVDSVISSTERIAGIINQELDWTDVNRMLQDRSCDVRLREITVGPGSPYEHKCLKDLGLPKGLILIAVLRGEQAIIPGGSTRLETGDMAVIWGVETDIAGAFGGRESAGGGRQK